MFGVSKSFSRSWLVAAVLGLSIFACAGPAAIPGTSFDYWETENNDSRNQANSMSLSYNPAADGYDYTGVIERDGTSEDWFRLATTQTGQLSATLTCLDLRSNERMYITLFNSALNELDERTLSASTGTSITASSGSASLAGTYYVRVETDGSSLRYDLTPGFSGGGAASDYWEIEDNDNTSQADEMPLNYWPGSDGYSYTGVISSEDSSEDWYRLTTTQYGQISVSLNCVDLAFNEHIYITLYTSGLNELDARTLQGTPGGTVTVRSAENAAPRDYYVRIDADSWTHRYDLTPEFVLW